MLFSEIETIKIKRHMDSFMRLRRPPTFVRDAIDIEYKIEQQNIIIFSVRHINERKYQKGIAKISLNSSQNNWILYRFINQNTWLAYRLAPFPTLKAAVEPVLDNVNNFFVL